MKFTGKASAIALAAALSAASCGTAAAGTVSGQVTSGGKPVPGVMVTAFDEAKTRRDTVYTDAHGRYSLTVDFAGKISLRARAPYFKDATKEVDLPAKARQEAGLAGNTVAQGADLSVATDRVLDFDMTKETDPAALSNALTASAHLTSLSWTNADTRAAFVSQCHFCHQVGNELTRVPRGSRAGTRPCGAWRAISPS